MEMEIELKDLKEERAQMKKDRSQNLKVRLTEAKQQLKEVLSTNDSLKAKLNEQDSHIRHLQNSMEER